MTERSSLNGPAGWPGVPALPAAAHLARTRRSTAPQASAERRDHGLDETRARLRERLPQLGGELARGPGPAGRHAHAGGQGDEVEIGPGQVEQVPGSVASGRHAY